MFKNFLIYLLALTSPQLLPLAVVPTDYVRPKSKSRRSRFEVRGY